MTEGSLVVGTTFAGRYRIDALLGRGGMGAVYRAHDETLGEDVALKTLELPRGHSDDALSRFRREVRLSRKVTHPNIARTHDLGTHDGVHYLTMELVLGEDLASRLERSGALPPTDALALFLPMLDGLAAAHAAGVIHRDLKPANVLLDNSGRAVLTDFGIARALEPSDATVKTGGLLGTPAYMSPEQVIGKPVDARSDIYAMGLILYEMLTHRMPFASETPMGIAIARLQEAPIDPRAYTPMPTALAETILSCLARDPKDRPASAADVAARLRGIDLSLPMVARPVSIDAPTVFAPIRPPSTSQTRGQRLAVLPFLYRGPADHNYVAEALSDELVDELSRVRGLSVLSSGAMRPFRDDRDPNRLRTELQADVVVDGTVQSDGSKIRISARLVDTSTGLQIASDRYDGMLENLFEMQDTIRRRISETLRVGITTATRRGDAPPEVVECYLRARAALREMKLVGPDAPLGLLEKALELAPNFAPAIATYAFVAIRIWFLPGVDNSRDWEQVARDAVARALELAADLAETHQAAASLYLHDAKPADAVRALSTALSIAPTYVEALEALGIIECEAGRPEQGMRRLRTALELDPSLVPSRVELARQAALSGDPEAMEKHLSQVDSTRPARRIAVTQLQIRYTLWTRDRAAAARIESELPGTEREPTWSLLFGLAAAASGRADASEAAKSVQAAVASHGSPRFRNFMQQIGTEMTCAAGNLEAADEFLLAAARGTLIDLTWLDKCCGLDPIRARPAFAEAREMVRKRVAGIWGGA